MQGVMCPEEGSVIKFSEIVQHRKKQGISRHLVVNSKYFFVFTA